jgi:hypothetical protein
MIFLGAFAYLRPEGLAELRRGDIDLDEGVVWMRRAAPELTNGKKVVGDPIVARGEARGLRARREIPRGKPSR